MQPYLDLSRGPSQPAVNAAKHPGPAPAALKRPRRAPAPAPAPSIASRPPRNHTIAAAQTPDKLYVYLGYSVRMSVIFFA
jgi:hypothetical protein